MTSSRAAPLLLAAAAVAAGAAWWLARNVSAPEPAVVPAAPEREVAESPAREDRGVPPLRASKDAAPPRAASERALTTRSAASTASEPADHALSVQGRVVLPPGVPPDEELFVVASGRRHADGEQQRSFPVDRDGRFRASFAPGTRRGRIGIEARYLLLAERARVELRDAPAELVLEPELGGRVHGRVSPPPARTGEPPALDGARVTATSASGTVWGTIDADGRFELGPLRPANDWRLAVRSREWVDPRGELVAIAAGEVQLVELALERGARVAGRVVDADGSALPDVQIRARAMRSDGREDWQRAVSASTDEAGAFELRGLLPGRVVLAVTTRHCPVFEEDLGELANGVELDGLVLRPCEGFEVAGFVRWPGGEPAAGASVELHQERSRFRRLALDADESGAFRFAGLDDEPCRLRASLRRDEPDPATNARRGALWEASTSELAPGSQGIELVLSAGSSVHGRVVDDTGAPIERFRIVAEPVGRGGDPAQELVNRFSGEDGRFELRGLRPGSWRLHADALSYAASEPQLVQVPGEAAPLALVLARCARIAGHVRGPDGAAVRGATVERSSAGSSGSGRELRSKRGTDGEGRFQDERADPGRCVLVAKAPGFAPSEALELELEPAEEREGLELRLRRAGRIEGALDLASDELAGRTVRVTLRDGQFFRQLTTDARGTFALDDLAAGRYRLELAQSAREQELFVGISGTPRDHVLEVELASGETRRVVLPSEPAGRIAVAGRVTAGGRAAAGWVVAWRAEGADEVVRAIADRDGAYRVRLDRAGTWTVMAVAGGGSIGAQRVEVPDRPAFEHRLELPVARLSGTVRSEDGRPLPGIGLRLSSTPPDGSELLHVWRSQRTDEGGRFAFDPLLAGEVRLEAGGLASDDPGAVEYAWTRTSVSLKEGEAREDFDLVLRVGGAVEGRVVDGSGQPVLSMVEFRPQGEGLSGPSSVGTDSLGRFQMRGLGPGPYLVTPRKGRVTGGSRNVVVESGRTLTVELVYDP